MLTTTTLARAWFKKKKEGKIRTCCRARLPNLLKITRELAVRRSILSGADLPQGFSPG